MNISNFSIGVDIESISRFQDLKRNKSKLFFSKIFTDNEMDYCFSKKAFAQHLAVRFAAKEAIIKAICSLDEKKIPLNKVEIIKKDNGVPLIKLKGYNIKISLSHCKDMAIAFAVVEKK